jgi:arginine exporter protein ArgO
MIDPTQNDAVARNRLLIIMLARLSGVVMFALGVLVIKGTIEMPEMVGYALVAVGIVEVLVIPQILVKRWRSDKE